MRHPILFSAAILSLPLAACGDAGEDDAAQAPEGTEAIAVDSGINDGNPDLTPPPLTPEAERGETGARNVLLSFARAIELKEFDQAWALMVPELREKLPREYFADTFAGLGTISVSAPNGTMEGAAGTSFYTVPTTITGSNGTELTGEIVLSRVNDVPGASEEQLQWRVRRFSVSSN